MSIVGHVAVSSSVVRRRFSSLMGPKYTSLLAPCLARLPTAVGNDTRAEAP